MRNITGARLAFLCFVGAETSLIVAFCAWRVYSDLPLTEATRPDCVYSLVILLNARMFFVRACVLVELLALALKAPYLCLCVPVLFVLRRGVLRMARLQ